MEFNLFIYQTTVELEDGIILVVLTDGPGDSEDIIQDYVYQKHHFAQPDKDKYRTINLTKDFDRVCELKHAAQIKLALKAIDYAECFQ